MDLFWIGKVDKKVDGEYFSMSFFKKNDKGKYSEEGTNDPKCHVRSIIHFGHLLTKQMKIRENAAKRIGEINAENDQWLIS
jgi:hypothetical protein